VRYDICVEVDHGAVSVPVCGEVPPEATADCVEVDGGVVSVPVCGDVGLSTICKFSSHFTHIYAAAVVAIDVCDPLTLLVKGGAVPFVEIFFSGPFLCILDALFAVI